MKASERRQAAFSAPVIPFSDQPGTSRESRGESGGGGESESESESGGGESESESPRDNVPEVRTP